MATLTGRVLALADGAGLSLPLMAAILGITVEEVEEALLGVELAEGASGVANYAQGNGQPRGVIEKPPGWVYQDKQNGALYVTVTPADWYVEGVYSANVKVKYEGAFYKSLQAANQGEVPTEPASEYWALLGANFGEWALIGGTFVGPDGKGNAESPAGTGFRSAQGDAVVLSSSPGSVWLGDVEGFSHDAGVEPQFLRLNGDRVAANRFLEIAVRTDTSWTFRADGGLRLPHGNALYNSEGAPSEVLGANGDWAIAADGNLYHKTGGQWVTASIPTPLVLRAAGENPILEVGHTGEEATNLRILADGSVVFNGGSDVTLKHAAAGVLSILEDNARLRFPGGNEPGLEFTAGFPEAGQNARLVHDLVANGPGFLGLYSSAAAGSPDTGLEIYGPGGTGFGTSGGIILTADDIKSGLHLYTTTGDASVQIGMNGAEGSLQPFMRIDAQADGVALDSIVHGAEPRHFRMLNSGQMNWEGDTHLDRAAAGVLALAEHGGGLRLTSPDGTKTKTITIDNAGAIALL